ncbi:MAG: OmpH family outer membrane protein [Cyclobacteriaceae bacterium]|nr:OmpH family outer membrane protein [Cyclobacteriaceae bacterium]MCH8515646.1 OmpH family outer membrane protein [Cyclobacteriaceae bacterium]
MKIKSTFALLICLLVVGFNLNAQQIKIGYTNVDYILSLMPESEEIDAELKAHERQLRRQFEAKLKEAEEKYEKFQREAATMTDMMRAEKQEELQAMQQQLQRFQGDAEQSLQKKQVELLQPVYDKIQSAIEVVAKRENYTQVFSSDIQGVPVLLYAADEENISDIVLKELGVDAR